MKISELSNAITAVKSQVAKIAAEQQARFDKITADVELPADALEALTSLTTQLQEFDDTIIDTETPTPS